MRAINDAKGLNGKLLQFDGGEFQIEWMNADYIVSKLETFSGLDMKLET